MEQICEPGICGVLGVIARQLRMICVACVILYTCVPQFAVAQLAVARAESVDAYGDPIPNGASVRLGSQRFRHHRRVHHALVLPDNETLLVVGDRLAYYELPTGKLKRFLPIRVRDLEIRQVVNTPDHKLLAIYGFQFDQMQGQIVHHIRVLETETGRQRFSYSTPDRVNGRLLAITPDGATLAFVGQTTQIWDVASTEEVLEYQFDDLRRCEAAEFSPDGESLVIGSRNSLLFWNWIEASEPMELAIGLRTDRIEPTCFAYSRNGEQLYVGTRSEVLKVDVQSKSLVGRLGGEPNDRQPCLDIEISQDGKRLISVGDPNTQEIGRVFDLEAGEQVQSYGGIDRAKQVSASLDGQHVVMTSNWDNLLEVYSADGTPFVAAQNNHIQPVTFLGFHPNSHAVVSASDDSTLRIWNLEDGLLISSLRHPVDEKYHTRWIRAADVSPDGRYFATSSLDDTVRVWLADTGEQIYELAGHGKLGGHRCVRFSQDGRKLYSFGDDQRIYTYDLATGKATQEYQLNLPEFKNVDPMMGIAGLINSCQFGQDGRLLALCLSDTVLVDRLTGKEHLRIAKIPDVWGRAAVLSPDSSLLLFSGLGPKTETRTADGRIMFSAGKDHTLRSYSASDGELLAGRQIRGAEVGPVAFRPDGAVVAVASTDRRSKRSTIRFLRATDLSELSQIDELEHAPRKLTFSGDGTQLAAGLRNTTILVWDLEEFLD